MDIEKLLPLLITVVFTLSGWVIVHRFTSKRDLENKKRETKIALITDVYRSISLFRSNSEESELSLINALTLLQCFGSESQCDMVQTTLKSIADPKSADIVGLGDILTSLREDFRKELDLDPISGPIPVVRRTKITPQLKKRNLS